MAIPFFDQLYGQCLLFSWKYQKYLLYFFKIQHIFFQNKFFYLKWIREEVKKKKNPTPVSPNQENQEALLLHAHQ